MLDVLIYYFLSVALLIAGLIGVCLFFKKKNIKVRLLFFFLGIIFAVVYFLILFALFFSTFNANNDQYFFSFSYLFWIGLAYVLILSLVRSLAIKGLFFSKEYKEQGLSFSFGFGAAPALLIGIYLLMFFFVIAYNGLFNGPAEWNNEGYFIFADNTIINLLLPRASGAFFAMIALVIYSFFAVAVGWLYKKISEKLYNWTCFILIPIGLGLLETAMILPIPYINMNSYWQLSIIAAVVFGLAVLLISLLPKEKDPAAYTKQFE